jgi:disulfide bond formation protein DsbB
VSTAQVSDFFAVLALGSLVIGGLSLAAALLPTAPARVLQLRPVLLPLGLAIAAVATAGSLYYSEMAGYPPCEMCWYQRICMYPLVAVLAVAVARRDLRGGWYALPPAVAGLGLSVYHYQLQLRPDQGSTCDVSAPCTYQWVDSLGFMSIPFMAGCGFVGVAGLAVLSLRSPQQGSVDGGSDPASNQPLSEHNP